MYMCAQEYMFLCICISTNNPDSSPLSQGLSYFFTFSIFVNCFFYNGKPASHSPQHTCLIKPLYVYKLILEFALFPCHKIPVDMTWAFILNDGLLLCKPTLFPA